MLRCCNCDRTAAGTAVGTAAGTVSSPYPLLFVLKLVPRIGLSFVLAPAQNLVPQLGLLMVQFLQCVVAQSALSD